MSRKSDSDSSFVPGYISEEGRQDLLKLLTPTEAELKAEEERHSERQRRAIEEDNQHKLWLAQQVEKRAARKRKQDVLTEEQKVDLLE